MQRPVPEFLHFHDLVLWLLLLGNTGQHANCKVTCHGFFTVNLFSSVLGSHSIKETPWVWFVLPHVWKRVVSARVAIAVIKHPNQNAALEEKGLFLLTLPKNSPLLREVRAQNWRQEPILRPWRRLLTGFLLIVYSASFLTASKTGSSEAALPIVSGQMFCSITCSSATNSMRHYLQLCLPILWGIFLH